MSKTPEEKLDIVRKETEAADTLFVGDGINDAPALMAAKVGIAFGQNRRRIDQAASANNRFGSIVVLLLSTSRQYCKHPSSKDKRIGKPFPARVATLTRSNVQQTKKHSKIERLRISRKFDLQIAAKTTQNAHFGTPCV